MNPNLINLKKIYANTTEDKGLQNVYTPVEELVEYSETLKDFLDLDKFTGTTIAIVYNVEWFHYFVCHFTELNRFKFTFFYDSEFDKKIFSRLALFMKVTNVDYIKINNTEPFFDTDMKFDKIIMNPPYCKNLHLKILAEAIEHLSEDGKCVNLSPVRWLQDPIAEYKKNSNFNKFEESISKHIENILVISAKQAYNVFNVPFWSDLGIYVCNRKSNDFYHKFGKQIEYWSLVEKIGLPLFLKKLNNVSRIADEYDKNNNYPFFIKCSRVHGNPGKRDEFDCITPKFDLVFNKKGHEKKEVYFRTKIEAENFFKTMNLIFFKFLKKLSCYPVGDFNNGLLWMGEAINPRTGLKGYESEWTDEDFYKFFNITEEEQKIIEETMEKYK